MASEAVKIKLGQLRGAHNHVKVHTFAFVYNERLNQLKSDLGKRWLAELDDLNVTDLKRYTEAFSREHNLKPEDQSELEDYQDSPEDFRKTLISIATHLNQTGETHVVLMDEVELKNVNVCNSNKINTLEIDLSYVAKFENVHFIFCLRPRFDGLKDFKVAFSNLQKNQHFCWLENNYRNTKAIQELMRYVQREDQSKAGYLLIKNIPEGEKLPPPLNPPDIDPCVIWIPTIEPLEFKALENVQSLIRDMSQGEENLFIAILHTKGVAKTFAKKLKQCADKESSNIQAEDNLSTTILHTNEKNQHVKWSGPHEDDNFNGGEADVIVFITDDSSLNVQTLARARRSLIIVTYESKWNAVNPVLLKKAASENLVKMIMDDSPYKMIKCKFCHKEFDDSVINQHVQSECPDRQVNCCNVINGCDWYDQEKKLQAHEECCSFELIKCDYCNGHFIRNDIDQHKNRYCQERPTKYRKGTLLVA